MTKEEMLKRLHEILEIVGPDRAFEISENTNERKTLWIHQTPGEDEYLMLSATKLFPISTIRNIVYPPCACRGGLYFPQELIQIHRTDRASCHLKMFARIHSMDYYVFS